MSGRISKESIVRAWAEKAESDLKAAKMLIAAGEDAPVDAICFHAQQCVEKYLKACLMHRDIEFGRTHDIEELTSKLPSEIKVPLESARLDELTSYAVDSRYPGILEDAPSMGDCRSAVDSAEVVRKAVRTVLNL